MSILCQTFVQNAWRSDLCSNCFKSLDDHSDVTRGSDRMPTNAHRYVPQASSLYQSRCISTSMKWRFSEPIYDRVAKRDFGSQTPPKTKTHEIEQKAESKGILVKNPDRRLRSRSSVDFASVEALVIGYGGNDYDSDLSPWEMGSDDGSIDLEQLDDNDEDRKITKMTKNNTEFNSSNQNLQASNNSNKVLKNENESSNNLKNNSPQNKLFDRSPEKTLNITYNNIQTDKVVSQYYFPSATDNLNSYSHNNNIEVNKGKNNKESSKTVENCKIDNFKRENVTVNDETCKTFLNEDFTPLNTQTYSFVSELSKNKSSNSEHNSSDSDYSTCRLTAGDSTDSESFHDVDEARIEPCPSFLHGNYPKNLSPASIRDLECDKKYDGGSSTSGDVSNLSDDSDSHESTKRTVYKSKTSKNSKTSIEAYNNNISRENVVHSSESSEFQPSTGTKTIQIRVKDIAPSKSQSPVTISNSKESNTNNNYLPESTTGASTAVDNIDATKNGKPVKLSSSSSATTDNLKTVKADKTVKLSISPSTNTNIQSNKTISEKSVSKQTSSSVSVDSVNSKNSKTAEEPIKTPSKSFTVKKESIKDNQASHKQLSKQKSLDSQLTQQQNISINNALSKRNSLDNRDKMEYDEGNDSESSPDTIAHRQSKLAALALELELARRDSLQENTACIPPQVTTPQMIDISTPKSVPPTEIPATTPKSTTVPCSSKLGPLPDVLQETPAKSKKNRFSLKKLLKRNKDSGTITPTNKETNPKAWKKQSFDRSRLSLEIVHPMDMTSDPATSGESTPTDDNHCVISNHPGKGLFKSGYSRARSLSALPQINSESLDKSNCSLLDCRKVETLPARKAGTVAERKKNRPSLVRTPSCSALPNRSQPTEGSNRVPPPKPPPPPKHKLHPPPPPPPPHSSKPKYPARPPPPKIPDVKYRNLSNNPEVNRQSTGDKEYANLGDIRSQLMPKKPERASALSAASRESETEENNSTHLEEEDPYSYLDESEVSTRGLPSPNDSVLRFKLSSGSQLNRIKPWLDLQTSYSAIAATNYESLAELITTSLNENIDYLKIAGKSIKFKDFTLNDEDPEVILPNRIICNAVYKNELHSQVMLMIFPRKTQHLPTARHQNRYPVLGSFMDCIPKELLISEENFASVYILRRSRVSTIQKFAETAASARGEQHVHLRDYCFVLLQLIHTLKGLQAEGIEEVNFDLERLILVTTTTEDNKPPILVLFPEDKTHLTLCDTSPCCKKTLCQATLRTLYHFLNVDKPDELGNCSVNGERLAQPVAHTFSAIAQVLTEEKASSLTQAKGLLEYMLWGPVDIKASDAETAEEVIETVLQRWLDLQRAQMVKSTLTQLHLKPDSTTAHMHVFEEYQLVFLLQASVKSLKNVISKL